jgi:hypothetical protein
MQNKIHTLDDQGTANGNSIDPLFSRVQNL